MFLFAGLLRSSVALAAKAPAERLAETSVAGLVARARELQLAKHPIWWRLLHYRSSLWGVKSEASGPRFFNSSDGRTDPEAELAATIKAFFGPAPKDPTWQHPICRFPARLAWLHANLGFDLERLPPHDCRRWHDFQRRTRAESITIIFSSYYLNTPASAFGHSFMKLNKRVEVGETRQDLLDYGIDFSANVDTSNALLYAFKGLTGLFAGEFSKRPYYFKVREYNDFESRDLWEFELNLTEPQVAMAVAHIWELGSAEFAYYYLTQNCSYQMLGILEVADVRVNLVDHVSWPVVPVDTIKALFKNRGLVRAVHYRPSVRSQFRQRLSTLVESDVDLVHAVSRDPDRALPVELSVERRVAILDAAIDLVDFEYARDLLDLSSPGALLKHQLLTRRASLARRSRTLAVRPPDTGHPASGHASRRLSLGSGWAEDNGYFHELGMRLALHDLSDPVQGFPTGLAITFLPTRLRYAVETPRLTLEDFSIVEILSLTPQNRFEHSLAWNFRLGATRLRDEGCRCVAPLAEVGAGAALSGLRGGVTAYLNLSTRLSGLAPIDHGLADLPLRVQFGPVSGLQFVISPNLVLFGQAAFSYLPLQTPRTLLTGTTSLRWQYRLNFALSFESEHQRDFISGRIASSFYF